MTARIVPDDAAGRAAAIEVLRAGGVVALPTDTVYGIAVALDTPGGIERLFHVKHRPLDKGIALLARLGGAGAVDRRHEAGRHGPRRGVLAGRADRRRSTAPGGAAAGRADRWRRDDRPARPGPRGPARARASRRSAADDLGQRVGHAGGPRRDRDPRPTRRRGRPHPRWRARPRRPGLDRRRLQRTAAADPPRRGDRGGAGGTRSWTRPASRSNARLASASIRWSEGCRRGSTHAVAPGPAEGARPASTRGRLRSGRRPRSRDSVRRSMA